MAMKRNAVPARRDDLLVQKVGEEVIVYDLASNRAHSLNRTAALVFEKLDGKRPIDAVAKDLVKTLGQPASKKLVAAAVNELASADLLRPGAALPRRSVLRGLAAGLLPVVVSIAVPNAASAQSCSNVGGPCTYNSDCCPGLICFSIGSPPVNQCQFG
jgi:Coenzyme PQQ synthesis protein D (PqqD)